MYVGGKIAPLNLRRSRDIALSMRGQDLGGFWGSVGNVFKNVVAYTFAPVTGGYSLALASSPTARRVGAITGTAFFPFLPARTRNNLFNLAPGQRGGLETEAKVFRGLDLAAAVAVGGYLALPAAPAGTPAAAAASGGGPFTLAPTFGSAGYGVLAAPATAPLTLASSTIAPVAASAAPAAGADFGFTSLAKAGLLMTGTQVLSSLVGGKGQESGSPQPMPQGLVPMPSQSSPMPMGGGGGAPGPAQISDSGQAQQVPQEATFFGFTLTQILLAAGLSAGALYLYNRSQHASA